MRTWSSWPLFAKSAACGDDLTRKRLYETARNETAWTGGGLHAASDLQNPIPPPQPYFNTQKATPGSGSPSLRNWSTMPTTTARSVSNRVSASSPRCRCSALSTRIARSKATAYGYSRVTRRLVEQGRQFAHYAVRTGRSLGEPRHRDIGDFAERGLDEFGLVREIVIQLPLVVPRCPSDLANRRPHVADLGDAAHRRRQDPLPSRFATRPPHGPAQRWSSGQSCVSRCGGIVSQSIPHRGRSGAGPTRVPRGRNARSGSAKTLPAEPRGNIFVLQVGEESFPTGGEGLSTIRLPARSPRSRRSTGAGGDTREATSSIPCRTAARRRRRRGDRVARCRL